MQREKRTKIVATLGPASANIDTVVAMAKAGMNIARLNLAHGSPASIVRLIGLVRRAERHTGKMISILADLPGPKMRIGQISGTMVLKPNQRVRVAPSHTAREGGDGVIPVDFPGLASAVHPGSLIYLADGFIALRVLSVEGEILTATVTAGGELTSHKGINLPGATLGISSLTEKDAELIFFALSRGADAISISFVQRADDLHRARAIAAEHGFAPFLFAKIEHPAALRDIDNVLEAADGIMVARGDLGIELPLEEIPLVQKDLIFRANVAGKPVITATQMLESMLDSPRPTRAEVTDVANAILDGTDAVMLSEESAMGRFPVEAVATLAKVALYTEEHATFLPARERVSEQLRRDAASIPEVVSVSVLSAVERLKPDYIVTPTESGATARSIAKFRPDPRIIALSPFESTARRLLFTAGVDPYVIKPHQASWETKTREVIGEIDPDAQLVLLTQGSHGRQSGDTNRIDILKLKEVDSGDSPASVDDDGLAGDKTAGVGGEQKQGS